MSVYCINPHHATPCPVDDCTACPEECDPAARIEAPDADTAAELAGVDDYDTARNAGTM